MMGIEKLILILILILMLTNCQSEQYSNNFWQGVWIVKYDLTGEREKIVIGYLLLETDQYYFTPIEPPNSIPESARQRLPFVNSPSGSIDVEIQLPYRQVSSNNIESGTTLALLRFENNRENFQIRLNQDKGILFFHGEFGEFQLWEIEKEAFKE